MLSGFSIRRGRSLGAVAIPVLLSVVLAVPCGPARAQAVAASGTARPEGEPSFGIPLAPWTVEAVAALKTEFVDGVAAEVLAVAEERAVDDVRDLAATSSELVEVGERIAATMNRIGTIDSSFGIDGISRLVTAEGALRDTLFGLVVWHDSAAGESRQVAVDLEGTVLRVNELAAMAERHSTDIAGGSDMSRDALGEGEYANLESSSSAVVRAMAGLIEVSDRLQEEATRLEEIVWKIQGGGETPLEGQWQQVLLSVSDVRRLAAKFRPAVESFESSNDVFWRITEALGGVVEATGALGGGSSDPRGARLHHIAPDVLERDVVIAKELEATVLSNSHNGYPEDAKAAIRELMRKLVTADGILAERAVEHCSTEVARAEDALEEFYGNVVGYNEDDPERRRTEALSRIDLAMRGNEDLQNARISARAARAALDGGTVDEGSGAGSESRALTRYVSAWSHAVNAGLSATRALGAVSSK